MKEFTVAIIGAPNVGKSTLFNRLIGKRLILENELPGTTRDRQTGTVQNDSSFINIIDSGGWNPGSKGVIESHVQNQTGAAFREADVILVLFDGKSGITPLDTQLIQHLRKEKKNVVYAVNKIDAPHMEGLVYEFYRLGIEPIIPVSALHNNNIDTLIEELTKASPAEPLRPVSHRVSSIRLSFVGRPNTGKSTLINTLCGEQRLIVTPIPGTTHDATSIQLEYEGSQVTIIDTPGLRKRKKPRTPFEGLMQISAQKTIHSSDIVGLLIDASEGFTSGDTHIAQNILKARRACFILLNKWDLVVNPELSLKNIMTYLAQKLPFIRWAPVTTVSAKTGLRTNRILHLAKEIFANYTQTLDTIKLNHVMSHALSKHPLRWKGKTISIKNITQVSTSPPLFQLEMNLPEMLHFSHIRYMENILREHFNLSGTPVNFKPKKTGIKEKRRK